MAKKRKIIKRKSASKRKPPIVTSKGVVIHAQSVHFHPDAPPLITSTVTPMMRSDFGPGGIIRTPVNEPDTYIVGMYNHGALRMFTDVETFCSYGKALEVAKERTIRHGKPFAVFQIAARTIPRPSPVGYAEVREFKR